MILKVNSLTTFAKKHILIHLYAFIVNISIISTRKKLHLMKFLRNIDKKQIVSLFRFKVNFFGKFKLRTNDIDLKCWKILKENIKYIFC